MKITGLILTVIGLLGGAVVILQIVQPFAPQRDAPPVAASEVTRPDMTIPLVICGIAVVAGLLMMMFGGRGYSVNYNPRVRN